MMMLAVVTTFIAVMMIGLISLIRDVRGFVKKYNFLMEFRNRFVKFAVKYFEDENFQEKEYRWLLENVDEASSLLGGAAKMTYRPPYASYFVNNYELLINLLPEFNSSMGAHRDNATAAESILTRFTGSLKKRIDKQQQQLKNPVAWLVEGITVLLSIPFFLLNEFGLLSGRFYDKVRNGKIIRIFAGTIGLISVIDTVYAVATGSSFSIQIAKQLIDKI